MLRDTKNDLIFTINELTQDEQEEWIKDQYRKQGLTLKNISAEDEADIMQLLD